VGSVDDGNDVRPRPAAVIVSYKKARGNPRITRIATTVADTGRDVTILCLGDTAETQEFSVNPHVRGLAFPAFALRAFLVRRALRWLNTLQEWITRLRWTR
jgi:hypothetical protein